MAYRFQTIAVLTNKRRWSFIQALKNSISPRSSISRRSLLAPSLGLRVIFGTGTISGTSVLVNFCLVIRVELFR